MRLIGLNSELDRGHFKIYSNQLLFYLLTDQYRLTKYLGEIKEFLKFISMGSNLFNNYEI